MKVPQDAHLMYMVFKIMDHGFTEDTIDQAMKKLVGHDWSETRVSTWHKRLQAKGFTFHDEADLFIDDLEALIVGRIKLDDLYA